MHNNPNILISQATCHGLSSFRKTSNVPLEAWHSFFFRGHSRIKFLLRKPAEVTNRFHCNSHREAFVNGLRAIMTPVGWREFNTKAWAVWPCGWCDLLIFSAKQHFNLCLLLRGDELSFIHKTQSWILIVGTSYLYQQKSPCPVLHSQIYKTRCSFTVILRELVICSLFATQINVFFGTVNSGVPKDAMWFSLIKKAYRCKQLAAGHPGILMGV